jgi:hypothetical protein
MTTGASQSWEISGPFCVYHLRNYVFPYSLFFFCNWNTFNTLDSISKYLGECPMQLLIFNLERLKSFSTQSYYLLIIFFFFCSNFFFGAPLKFDPIKIWRTNPPLYMFNIFSNGINSISLYNVSFIYQKKDVT